jgi:hypothetical protein
LFYLLLKEAILETTPPECSVYFFATEAGAFHRVQFTPAHAMKAQRGSRSIALPFL